MDYTQNEWLYGILCEYGFDEAVRAFRENIAKLGFEGKLEYWVGVEVANLNDTTVDREEYLDSRIAKCEREMRAMRTVATDEMKRDKYQTVLYFWNYVLAQSCKAALLERASAQTQPTAAEQQSENDEPQREYSAGLINLFREHTELIDELVGLSDDEIARKIKKWATQRDKLGNALIENPKNNLRAKYARELRENFIIKGTEERFKRKL